MHQDRRCFYDLTREELRALVVRRNLSPVHAERIWGYVYLEGVDRFADMPEVPARASSRLESELDLALPSVVHETHSSDGFTRKYLLRLLDAHRIETVLMRFTGRVTACVSTQAGCALACVFCATGQMGFGRNLAPGEIVAQALHINRVLRPQSKTQNTKPKTAGAVAPARLRNVVLMGMGEPLHNYDAVMKAADILRDPHGPAISARRITLSTVGVVPGIIRLADERRPIHLAVSLHAATQEERAALVPVAKKWPLDALLNACRYYIEKQQRRIFFEWTLISGRNDTPAQAHAVGRLLQDLRAQVNLIPLNPTAGYDGVPSDRTAARRFQDILAEHGLPSTVRQRRGIDIAAGCGQLATATR
ncbi:MAG: 23S rRNA (adenine(2503)-C(2))-methyltransferase [Verrucomicrobia bacterium RIFCSPLOWO2_12_FULL_64_8]|nr:MAG: 23S rRNA (adenine(2503)-C(2))-methyltransferase [Verrucomicrobia bacterium RIFCSPLOWO2_12_FULL_64_8]